ncbi:hypothetical protein RvY_14821 [Ramazzottius varieornatus]|uniref:ZZ-type domain-containing protein n=1 Tax=Ramazzottius varieornatus TaxID=947166 RepID=A0A1D1VZU9_RAMVA|nr:hypothetical protein RvY_14821 [Ramazzottius varieornatus]
MPASSRNGDNMLLEQNTFANNDVPNPKPILDDFNAQDLNAIRFSAYRTACKLLYIQKKTCLHLLDLVNMIEIISRQSNLESHDLTAEITAGQLRGILHKMFTQLNQRVPVNSGVRIDQWTEWLLYWLLAAYDASGSGSVRLFALKIALALLCYGKLKDKLTYIFGLLCGEEGIAIPQLLDNFLHVVLQLPRACGEGPSFAYSASTYADCFPTQRPIHSEDFVDLLTGVEPGPPPVVWLNLMHSISQAQSVQHNVHCNSCHRNGFQGFRYRCQQCPNYQSCQDCFWKGRVNGRHTLEHEMKETSSTHKSPARQLSHSLRRSFRRSKSPRSRLIAASGQPYSLSATASPEPTKKALQSISGMLPLYNGTYSNRSPSDYNHGTYGTLGRQQRRPSMMDTPGSQDDEHVLIARYAAMLQNQQAGHTGHNGLPPASHQNGTSSRRLPQIPPQHNTQVNMDHIPTSFPNPLPPPPYSQPPQALSSSTQNVMMQQSQDGGSKEQIIAELEARNREILREIARMRREQMTNSQILHSSSRPMSSSVNLLNELKALRLRKDELESHMIHLRDNRKHLMDQLEIWMKRLKVSHSSRSPPTSLASPRSQSASGRKYSTLPRMGHRSPTPQLTLAERSQHGGSQNWQADLLSAADSVTNAMKSLVRELNSEDDSEFATAMTMHGNGAALGGGTGGRKSVKLYTVPTVYPSDDEVYNNSPSASHYYNSDTSNTQFNSLPR